MVQDTKINYDGAQAIAELKKIADAARQSADAQIEALDGVEGRLDSIEGALGRVNPRLATGLKNLRGVAGVAGPAGIALSGVAVAVGGLAANFVDLPNLLRDSTEEIDTFRRNSEQLLALRQAAASIGTDLLGQGTTEGLDRLNARQAALDERRTELANDRFINRDKLQNARDRLRRLEAAVRESARKRARIEKEAAKIDTQRDIAEATQGTTAGRGVLNLASAAEEAALEGNIEKAKALVDEAKERSRELGNHSLFTRAISQAEGAIADKNEAANQANQDRTKQLRLQVQLQKQKVEGLRAEQDQINKNLAEANKQQSGIRIDRLNLQQQGREQARRANIQGATRQLDIGIDILNKEIGTARGPVQAFTDTIKGLGEAFKRGGPEFESEVKAINTLEERTRKAVESIAQRTPESIKRGVEQLAGVQSDLRRLEDAGPLDSALKFNVEAIRNAIQTALDEIVPATRSAVRGGVRGAEPIVSGAEDVVQARADAQRQAANLILGNFEASAEASETIKRNLLEIQGRPANAAIPQQQAVPAANQGAATTTRAEITVPVNVRGGLIDRDTQEQLGDIVAQQVRKELSAQGLV